jgi:hypothetical protein
MSTLPDTDDFDLLSGDHKSMKDGSQRCATPPINGWSCNSYRAQHSFCFFHVFSDILFLTSKYLIIYCITKDVTSLFDELEEIYIFHIIYYKSLIL